ncbi:hypothetical protein CsSME_00043727 [Camellia sinensis var. sinensis]
MKLKHCSMTLLFFISLTLFPYLIQSQTCQRTCGKQPIKYPFGTGPGCGDPRFQTHITCSQDQLTFSTHTGCYPVTSIDYTNQVLYITDPSMSTCSCTQPSKGFSLDWDAPFSFHDDNTFALLDCSTTSSPIYKTNPGNNSTATAVSRLDTPVATCCVYTPVDLGPSFEMDLQKLQCTSYSGIYGFGGKNDDPGSWQYGVALKYKFNYNNEFPTNCENCERSNGACGYSGTYNSFVCNCPSGLNTTTDCFFAASWNHGLVLLPWQTGKWVIYCLAWFLVLL